MKHAKLEGKNRKIKGTSARDFSRNFAKFQAFRMAIFLGAIWPQFFNVWIGSAVFILHAERRRWLTISGLPGIKDSFGSPFRGLKLFLSAS